MMQTGQQTYDVLKAYRRDVGKGRSKKRVPVRQLARWKLEGKEGQILHTLLPYVLGRVRKYQALANLQDYDFTDLVQEANIAAWLAIRRWNPARGAAITSMIKYAVKGRMNRLAEKLGDYSTVSLTALQEPLEGSDGGFPWIAEELLADSSHDPELVYQYLELVAYLDKYTEELPERQGIAVRLFCGLDDGNPMHMSEIAREMSISPAAASRLLSRGLKNILS